MRFYPLHIFIKDVSFVAIYWLVPDSNFTSFDPGAAAYLAMALSAIVVNLAAQSILYFGFRRYLKFKSWPLQFLYGAILHFPTLILWWDLHSDSDPFPFRVAVISSVLISAISYVVLNNENVPGVLKNKLTLLRKRSSSSTNRGRLE